MAITEEKKNNNKWIWIGLGAATLFCLCAVGVAMLVFMRLGQQFKEGMKTDPQDASEAEQARLGGIRWKASLLTKTPDNKVVLKLGEIVQTNTQEIKDNEERTDGSGE